MARYFFRSQNESLVKTYFEKTVQWNLGGHFFVPSVIGITSLDEQGKQLTWGVHICDLSIGTDTIGFIEGYVQPGGYVFEFSWKATQDLDLYPKVEEIIINEARFMHHEVYKLPINLDKNHVNNGTIFQNSPKVLIKMTPWRKHRAELFKEVKDNNPNFDKDEVAKVAYEQAKTNITKSIMFHHPDWSPDKVYANFLDDFQDLYSHKKLDFTEDDVNNDYRDMGWSWERKKNIK